LEHSTHGCNIGGTALIQNSFGLLNDIVWLSRADELVFVEHRDLDLAAPAPLEVLEKPLQTVDTTVTSCLSSISELSP
jgi:hypothetical protein